MFVERNDAYQSRNTDIRDEEKQSHRHPMSRILQKQMFSTIHDCGVKSVSRAHFQFICF